MYVTRPLSHYRQFPSSLSLPPPEGPNSGYLVIQDEESVETQCFGLCTDPYLKDFPFPQNKRLTVEYTTSGGEHRHTHRYKVFLIPVLDQPLSSNRYYVIKAQGRHQGEAYTSSKEEDKVTCCFCSYVKDEKPRALDHEDIYQQIEITRQEISCCDDAGFHAKSLAPDGFPPDFLRIKGWRIYASTQHIYQLGEALGLDASLRARLPQFNFPLSNTSSGTVVVGKWYCPFMFIKEEEKLKDQMKKSMFYEITLEQKWEQIYACENNQSKASSVAVDVVVQREIGLTSGREPVQDDTNVVDGVVWFRTLNNVGGVSVGLSLAIVERMKWEQERGGRIGGNERQVRVERVEEFGGESGWSKFGCYILVERYCLKRMDGSLLFTYDFRHTHQIQSKWE
ncbi:hypothetical protein HHK36_033205 [Tetracentron sinense]|uniref:Uncharacterized protein n=1 Tax=Tetracentron sinense TaxID=13715 RepID=A0A835CZR4_TETSI|nr:hypothetical protein HHK36_033205 [Tetracentron sinense]